MMVRQQIKRIFPEKNGDGQLWWILGFAFIVIVVVIISLLIFNRGSGKIFGTFDQQLTSLQDCDLDGVKDFLDACVCTSGEASFKGCPNEEPTAEQKKERRSSCSPSCPDLAAAPPAAK